MTVENNTSSKLRHPRAIVKINKIEVKFVEIEIRSGAPYTADTYFVEIPLYGQNEGINLAYFSSVQAFMLQIYMGFPDNHESFTTSDLTLMIQGESNDVEIEPSEGIVRISGRDLSSRLIDNMVSVSYSDITASELAKQFAEDNELESDITDTSTPLGTFLQSEQTYTANNTTQWDMLVNAAQLEDCLVYVNNNKLVFKPIPDKDSKDKYILKYTPRSTNNNIPVFENGTRISFFKNNIVSGNVRVTVKVPYSTYTGKAFHVKQNARNSKVDDENAVRNYVYSHPGLTNDQAEQKARQLLKDITLHSVRFSADLVADTVLSRDMIVKVTGTNSDFDQDYYIDSIVRRMSINDFSMFVSGRNRPPTTELSD